MLPVTGSLSGFRSPSGFLRTQVNLRAKGWRAQSPFWIWRINVFGSNLFGNDFVHPKLRDESDLRNKPYKFDVYKFNHQYENSHLSITRWWFQIFFNLHPENWGRLPLWRAYCSNGWFNHHLEDPCEWRGYPAAGWSGEDGCHIHHTGGSLFEGKGQIHNVWGYQQNMCCCYLLLVAFFIFKRWHINNRYFIIIYIS